MSSYEAITRLVSIITSMREPFDHHGAQVAGVAVNFARAMEMEESEIEIIAIGAQLHDIGKLLIRGEILNAPRKLTEAERAEMETHCALGWAIVNEADYAPTIKEIVRHHHERFDGKGYPDGLAGDQIPLAARLVAICDAYEALTSQRPYREAYSHNFAMAMIQKEKRRVFDPELVDLFFAKVAHG